MLEPTISDLLDVAKKGVQGAADKAADFIRGSDYEALIGPSAIIWSRQAERDTDLFNSINFNTADGEELTNLAFLRFGKDRILDTRGTGIAVIQRATSGTAETIWKGTHISLQGPQPRTYIVTDDVPVATSDISVPLPIEAAELGPGSAIDIDGPGAVVDDILEDASWAVVSLQCADGAVFEPAGEFRTRIRRERLEGRVGQSAALIATCKEAGADNVALFRSDYAGDAYDYGLNFCYVGDSGYNSTPELVEACTLALRATRVAGDSLQALQMQPKTLDVTALVYLYDSPSLFDLTRLERIHGESVVQYLNGAAGRFSYTLDGIRTAIARHTPEVQRVTLTTPTVEDTILIGDLKNFPYVLNRYKPGKIIFQYLSA